MRRFSFSNTWTFYSTTFTRLVRSYCNGLRTIHCWIRVTVERKQRHHPVFQAPRILPHFCIRAPSISKIRITLTKRQLQVLRGWSAGPYACYYCPWPQRQACRLILLYLSGRHQYHSTENSSRHGQSAAERPTPFHRVITTLSKSWAERNTLNPPS